MADAITQYETVYLSVGRDHRLSSSYEYVIYGRNAGQEDGEIVARKGCFKSPSQARRAGIKAAQPFQAPSLFEEV